MNAEDFLGVDKGALVRVCGSEPRGRLGSESVSLKIRNGGRGVGASGMGWVATVVT